MKSSNKVLSPIKENISKEIESSPNKNNKLMQNDTIKELIAFIEGKGMKIPNDLIKKTKVGQKIGQSLSLKLISTSSTADNKAEKEIKELKIKLNDMEFERKKVEQDFAQFKLSLRQQKQREVKRWEQSYNHLKQFVQDSSENSSQKYKQLKQKSEKEIKQIKQKHQKELQQQRDNLVANYEKEMKYLNEIHGIQIRQQVDIQKKALQKERQTHRLTLQSTKNDFQNEIKNLNNKHKNIMENKQKQYQSRITALVSQKRTQQKLHQKTKLQSNQIKEKLYNQLYYEKKARNEVQDQLQKKNGENRQLKRNIQDLKIQIELINSKHRQQVSQLKDYHAIEINNIKESQKRVCDQMKRLHCSELEEYTQRIEQLQVIHDQRQQIWESQAKLLASQFEERPSKKQDLDTIEKLKNKISQKEEEIKYLNRQLKYCMLELQNKQETYTKIFTSQKKIDKLSAIEQHRKSMSRDQKSSRDNLARKSQTSDFKFLLKVYNKQF